MVPTNSKALKAPGLIYEGSAHASKKQKEIVRSGEARNNPPVREKKKSKGSRPEERGGKRKNAHLNH